MIPAYSPQARGRSERSFSTWQGRLPQELRLRNLRTLQAANEFLSDSHMEEFNERWPAAQLGHAFLPVRGKNLGLIFSLHHERSVGQDNTVRIGPCVLQIEKNRWRATLAGCRVAVYQHLDGSWSIGYGPHCVGRYSREGMPLLLQKEIPRRSKRWKSRARSALGNRFAIPTFPPPQQQNQSLPP